MYALIKIKGTVILKNNTKRGLVDILKGDGSWYKKTDKHWKITEASGDRSITNFLGEVTKKLQPLQFTKENYDNGTKIVINREDYVQITDITEDSGFSWLSMVDYLDGTRIIKHNFLIEIQKEGLPGIKFKENTSEINFKTKLSIKRKNENGNIKFVVEMVYCYLFSWTVF